MRMVAWALVSGAAFLFVLLAALGLWCVLYVANRAVRVAVRRSISRLQ